MRREQLPAWMQVELDLVEFDRENPEGVPFIPSLETRTWLEAREQPVRVYPERQAKRHWLIPSIYARPAAVLRPLKVAIPEPGFVEADHRPVCENEEHGAMGLEWVPTNVGITLAEDVLCRFVCPVCGVQRSLLVKLTVKD